MWYPFAPHHDEPWDEATRQAFKRWCDEQLFPFVETALATAHDVRDHFERRLNEPHLVVATPTPTHDGLLLIVPIGPVGRSIMDELRQHGFHKVHFQAARNDRQVYTVAA